jgi:hypothetical protein
MDWCLAANGRSCLSGVNYPGRSGSSSPNSYSTAPGRCPFESPEARLHAPLGSACLVNASRLQQPFDVMLAEKRRMIS